MNCGAIRLVRRREPAGWALRAEIDAVVARRYGLDRSQYDHLLRAFSHRSHPDAPALCLAAFDRAGTVFGEIQNADDLTAEGRGSDLPERRLSCQETSGSTRFCIPVEVGVTHCSKNNKSNALSRNTGQQ